MADPNTLRILSFDGGGVRGYISANFMKLFVQEWGINPNEIWKHFDVIAGTSIGGVQALGYANGRTPDQIKQFFIDDAPWIFSTSAIMPGVRATLVDKIWGMLLGTPFYSNVNLIAKLEEEFGTQTLQDMNTNTIMTSYRPSNRGLILFSNVDFPNSFDPNELVKNVALATSSAPLYFPIADLGATGQFEDGGVWCNNPVQQAISVGKLLKPYADRFCILSVGTGGGELDSVVPPSPPPFAAGLIRLYNLATKELVGGPQEGNSLAVQLEADGTLFPPYYYRFQYQLAQDIDTGLDNTTQEFFDYMEASSVSYFNSDIENISAFIAHLEA